MKRQRWCDRPGMSPVLHKLFADAGTVSKRFAPWPRGQNVTVEVDLAPGLPGIQLVGLPDKAIQESRERVRSALRNSGFRGPLVRVVINLAPAD